MEFDRLREARGWRHGSWWRLGRSFLAALKSEKVPIVVFLRDREISRYRYGSGCAEMGFEKPMEAHKRIWEQDESELGRDIWTEESRER